MAAEWILGESTGLLRFASTVGPGTILLQKEKAFGKNFGKQLFCFFSSFVCKIAPIKVKYLFQNSWYLSHVVSKVMSFKIKASQNFSNQLYVVFFSYFRYITKILTDHFDKSTMSIVHVCVLFQSPFWNKTYLGSFLRHLKINQQLRFWNIYMRQLKTDI